jgi:hypothetical protein
MRIQSLGGVSSRSAVTITRDGADPTGRPGRSKPMSAGKPVLVDITTPIRLGAAIDRWWL